MDQQIPNQPFSGGSSTTETSGGLPTSGPASTAFVSGKNRMGRRKKALIVAGAAAVVTLGVAGYVFGYYLPNQPNGVFSRALSNTSKGYDRLIDYVGDKNLEKKFSTTEMSGTLSLSGQGASGDGTFKGKMDEKGNATFSGDFGMSGVRLNFEGMSKDVDSSESPDMYFKVKGLKGIDQLSGMGLEQFDDKWVSVDHTFFDTYAQQTVGEQTTKTPTQEQAMDAAKKIGEVNKQYLFTDDKSKAVFEMKEYKGKEVVDNKNTMHYVVRANKDRLKTYADELGKALNRSKLNDWAKETSKKNLSELVDIKKLKEEVNSMKDDTFDMWVNTKTKMVHKIRLQSSSSNYYDIGLNYNGGNEYPFFISSKEGKNTYNLTLSLNTKTYAVKLNVDGKSGGESAMAMRAKMEFKPVSGKVDVTVPANAMPLMEALGGFMGAGGLGGSTGTDEGGGIDGSDYDFTGELDPYAITQ